MEKQHKILTSNRNISITITISKELLNWIDEMKRKGIPSRSYLVREALRLYREALSETQKVLIEKATEKIKLGGF